MEKTKYHIGEVVSGFFLCVCVCVGGVCEGVGGKRKRERERKRNCVYRTSSHSYLFYVRKLYTIKFPVFKFFYTRNYRLPEKDFVQEGLSIFYTTYNIRKYN